MNDILLIDQRKDNKNVCIYLYQPMPKSLLILMDDRKYILS